MYCLFVVYLEVEKEGRRKGGEKEGREGGKGGIIIKKKTWLGNWRANAGRRPNISSWYTVDPFFTHLGSDHPVIIYIFYIFFGCVFLGIMINNGTKNPTTKQNKQKQKQKQKTLPF